MIGDPLAAAVQRLAWACFIRGLEPQTEQPLAAGTPSFGWSVLSLKDRYEHMSAANRLPHHHETIAKMQERRLKRVEGDTKTDEIDVGAFRSKLTTLFPLRAHDDIRVEISKWQAGHSARKRCFSDNSGAFWLMVIQPSVEGEDGDHEEAQADHDKRAKLIRSLIQLRIVILLLFNYYC